MKILKLFITIFMVVSACMTTAARDLLIYRNDRQFNMVKLDSTTSMQHIQGEDGYYLAFPDSETQPIELSAIDSCIVRRSDIPVLRFTFPDYPDRYQVWDKENYINATLSIDGNGYSDNLEETTLTVKGRGNSSWSKPKKPMRLKFPSKTSICGLKKAKSYVLLADYLDNSHMKNAVAFWLAQRIGVPCANTGVPCHVYINDRYTGAFLLTHKIGINSASVDIEETEGMLFELSTEFDENYKFYSDIYKLPVMVKDPDFDELYEDDPEGPTPEERLALWEGDFNKAVYSATYGEGFDEFDLDSFVGYLLVNNIVYNDEIGHPKSLYLHKSSMAEGEVYRFGPVWDFDVAFDLLVPGDDDTYTPRRPDSPIWLNYLFKSLIARPGFAEAYKARFDEFEKEILPDLLDFIDQYAALIEPSAKLDGLAWPEYQSYGWIYRTPSFDHRESVAHLKEWLVARTAFLRSRLDNGYAY
ncbi:MAG: CotH kinase family protein [Muribaculaceae bacterium]|nr:CotH kinase family protein [Muribaculaceae bacterium]